MEINVVKVNNKKRFKKGLLKSEIWVPQHYKDSTIYIIYLCNYSGIECVGTVKYPTNKRKKLTLRDMQQKLYNTDTTYCFYRFFLENIKESCRYSLYYKEKVDA